MIKLLLLLFTFLIIPLATIESFSYIGGDMIDQEIINQNEHFQNNSSSIIKFNDNLNSQQLKRYIIFGQGSISEIGTNLNQYGVSTSNGFFSIITIPESTASIFQSLSLIHI